MGVWSVPAYCGGYNWFPTSGGPRGHRAPSPGPLVRLCSAAESTAPGKLGACQQALRNAPDQPCTRPQCPVQSLQDAVKGLFVCCVFLDYVALSQRVIPELSNFLAGILHMATPNKQSQGELVPGSFFKYIVLQKFKGFGSNS